MGKINQQPTKTTKSPVGSIKKIKPTNDNNKTKKASNKSTQNLKKTSNKTIAKPEKPKNFGSAARRGGRMHPKKKPNKPAAGGIGFGVKNHQFNHFEQQRLDRIRERDERKAKKQEKILLRKKEHNKKQKILSKKNRKGQPIMQGRMELLLQKIQKKIL